MEPANEIKPRRDKRINVMLGAGLRHKSQLQTVRLTNVSDRGAGVMGQAPAIGSAVILERGDLKIYGRIAWATPGFFGIDFDQPDDASRIINWRPKKGTTIPEHARAVLRHHDKQAAAIGQARHRRDPLEFGMRVIGGVEKPPR